MFFMIPPHERRLTISTAVTLLRFVLVPFIVHAITLQLWGKATIFFMLAAATDFIDGALARLLNEQTVLGACLDPIADKFLLLSSFIALSWVKPSVVSIPSWLVMLMVFREVVLVSGSVLVCTIKGAESIRPAFIGKLTTLVQTIFLSGIFVSAMQGWAIFSWYYSAIFIVALLVCFSLAYYVNQALVGCGLVRGW